MKNRFRCLVLFVLLSMFLNTSAQKIPPFRIVLGNGKFFKAEQLPMGMPIIIVYFSPECDHCEVFTRELIKNQNTLKNVSIAMITYLPLENVNRFIKKFSLQRFCNIYVGTEGNSFFVRNYYEITDMPFAGFYTKNGDFVKSYSKDINFSDLVNKLQKLK